VIVDAEVAVSPLQQYLLAEVQLKTHCAADREVLGQLNIMGGVALSALAGPQQQQQQQQQQALERYIAAEVQVKAFCAGSADLVAALNRMGGLALQALTRGQRGAAVGR
jgi:hypothetical protein